MNTKTITVLAASTQRDVLEKNCDVEYTHFETLKEARERAKYILTDDHMRHIESSVPMNYSQVILNGECVSDYFRKGYNEDTYARQIVASRTL